MFMRLIIFSMNNETQNSLRQQRYGRFKYLLLTMIANDRQYPELGRELNQKFSLLTISGKSRLCGVSQTCVHVLKSHKNIFLNMSDRISNMQKTLVAFQF